MPGVTKLKVSKTDAQDFTDAWFAKRGWSPLEFQKKAWQAFAEKKSGLIHVPTGAGKTFAAYFGPLMDMIENKPEGLTLLYVTPLRAVARDIEKALRLPLEELDVPITLGVRNGDTSSSARAKQKRKSPNILITTPESLSLLLSYKNAHEIFGSLRSVIIDEWHELMNTKRGTQTELALARLRAFRPDLQTWGLSATIKNLNTAAQALVGSKKTFNLISQENALERVVHIKVLLPENVDGFPWAGHLGASMAKKVLELLDSKISTLVFTNTRSQAERWSQIFMEAHPEWAELMAVHHGSIERKEREKIEGGLKSGLLKIVVATSSLDLGVDFSPVERVFQIGSPKSVARLLQRAGRAAHRPQAPCEITLVPTNSLELIEMAALKKAVRENHVEERFSLKKPLDVLAQHLVTVALGGGFQAPQIKKEIMTTVAYEDLDEDEFQWTLDMLTSGGFALQAYPQYRKLELHDGTYSIDNSLLARFHRMNIGTITSDASIEVGFLRGKRLGSVEESFISRLKSGDVFVFAGRSLKLAKIHNNRALVRASKLKPTITPRWLGGRLPFSPSLSELVREEFELARDGIFDSPEMLAARPLLWRQMKVSMIPRKDECLAELTQTREGYHLFLFPFEGRLVHEGLASILALRFARREISTFSLSVNDYGLEILSLNPFDFKRELTPEIFNIESLISDLKESLNMTELAKRQFREIARVAGLVFQNIAGAGKTTRQVQVSSSLLFDVFKRYEPGNLLVQQAETEVLTRQFEEDRLARTLRRLEKQGLTFTSTKNPSPLAFPLVVERMGAVLSNESIAKRVERIKASWIKNESLGTST